MAWQDYLDITDAEIATVLRHHGKHYRGLDDVAKFARASQDWHPLHTKSREILAAHLADLVAKSNLYAGDYEVTPKSLKLDMREYKALVRKALAAPDGISHKTVKLTAYAPV